MKIKSFVLLLILFLPLFASGSIEPNQHTYYTIYKQLTISGNIYCENDATCLSAKLINNTITCDISTQIKDDLGVRTETLDTFTRTNFPEPLEFSFYVKSPNELSDYAAYEGRKLYTISCVVGTSPTEDTFSTGIYVLEHKTDTFHQILYSAFFLFPLIFFVWLILNRENKNIIKTSTIYLSIFLAIALYFHFFQNLLLIPPPEFSSLFIAFMLFSLAAYTLIILFNYLTPLLKRKRI